MSSDYRTDIFALTGMPRSGTTYLAAVLHHPPGVVTLSEAGGRWKKMYERDGRDADVVGAMEDFHHRVQSGEPMATFQGTPGYEGRGRVDTWNQKKIEKPLEVAAGFALGLKNPEVFLGWLDRLTDAGVRCVITLRHPVGIINSWVQRGQRRLRAGKSLDGTFANGDCVVCRSQAADPADRRIELHNHLASLILAAAERPGVLLIRHEDWFTDRDQLRRVTEFLHVPNPGRLQPEPIPPESPTLGEDEQERILRGCVMAEAFGYPARSGRLEPPTVAQAAGSP